MVAQFATPLGALAEVTPRQNLRLNFHDGQARAFWSESRITLVLAGTQSGKTTVGPPWLWRQIQRGGPGDYLVGSPTFSLMELKALPEFLRFFKDTMRFGDYVSSPIRKFTFNAHGNRRTFGVDDPGQPTHVYFGYGSDPDSLESATAKAAWLDEAGQRLFKRASFEAVRRRLSLAEGPILITTTPYNLAWLKTDVYDRRDDAEADITVINFASDANPTFPAAEWERAKRELPAWKFNMFYRGLFERPAGLIYDCFDASRHVIPAFTVPQAWPRFLGLDFGGVNTAGVFLAEEQDRTGKPTGRHIAYREYHAGGRTASGHAAALLAGEPRAPRTVGGSHSEGQWRKEFAAGGLGVAEPSTPDVEVGIQRVYGALQTDRFIMMDSLVNLIDDLHSYSRVLDDRGEPTEAIEDKSTWHRCFVAGTRVTTDRGAASIESLRPRDRVLTRGGYRPITHVALRSDCPLREVTFSDGRALIGTPEHPVWVVGRGWTPIDSLRYNDRVIGHFRGGETWQGERASPSTASPTIATQMPKIFPIAATSDGMGSAFIGRCGRLLMGQSLPAFTSITLTKTTIITISTILSFSLPQLIPASIMPAQRLTPNWRTLIASARLRLRGIGPTRGERGTAITASRHGPTGSRSSDRALIAARSSRASRDGQTTVSAPMPASPRRGEQAALTTLTRPANDAARCSERTDTPRRDTAPLHVVSVRDAGRGTVYALSIDEVHEYFANGVLVSNCDALRYVGSHLWGRQQPKLPPPTSVGRPSTYR